MLGGGNPNARHHGKGLERATFRHGVELSYCLVTVRALTETGGLPLPFPQPKGRKLKSTWAAGGLFSLEQLLKRNITIRR